MNKRCIISIKPVLIIIILFLMIPGAFSQDPGDLVIDDPSAFAPCTGSCQGSPPSPPGASRVNKHNIEQVLIDEYMARWGVALSKPAYIFTRRVGLGAVQPVIGWTSVAYLDKERYRLYVQPDGTVSGSVRSISVSPAYLQKTLTVVIDHGNTNIGDVIDTLWVDAQDAINADHWQHAAEIGLAQPIVGFDFINLLVSADELADTLRGPKTPARVYEVLISRGIVLKNYDLIVVMDMDPAHPAGGFAFLGGTWSYIGYFFAGDPGFVMLPDELLRSVARALYHHEVGHAWSWEHEWDPASTTYSGPMIVNPRLYGWTDTDGDGVPEILDNTPYGGP